VSHPDDEVLGAGATMHKLTKSGKEINVCILCGDAEARTKRPKVEVLKDNITTAAGILGVNKSIAGNFPNIEMNTVPHLEIVQFIENAIRKVQAEVVITHHPADLNNDHLNTSIACQAAVRLFQRRDDVLPIKDFLFMEVLSATEWGLNPSLNQFNPNTYVEIFEEGIEKKIESLSKYKGVMRDYPHPRSKESLRALATYRGSQAGVMYAEAFQSVFRRYL
jgi:LmbE family N-acetylglucosaminyl deacetylase